MKNQIQARPGNYATANIQRPAGIRPQTNKSIEHRHERRKIREQLRRADWAPGLEDGIFA